MISDFGLSKMGADVDQMGTACGTPGYVGGWRGRRGGGGRGGEGGEGEEGGEGKEGRGRRGGGVRGGVCHKEAVHDNLSNGHFRG